MARPQRGAFPPRILIIPWGDIVTSKMTLIKSRSFSYAVPVTSRSDMAEFAEHRMHQQRSFQKPHYKIRINASRGLKRVTVKTNLDCRRRPGAINDIFKEKRDPRPHEKTESSNSEFLEALEAKECMFEVQSVLLGKLAQLENNLKSLVENPRPITIDFHDRVREVEDALLTLKW